MADGLLEQLLRAQEEVRALEIEAAAVAASEDPEQLQHASYSGSLGVASPGSSYLDTSRASIPQGTYLAAGEGGVVGETRWGDHPRNAEAVAFKDVPCANAADCLDDDFCYSWHDCGECEWCENNQCVERDPARTCNASWECPCPPTDEQFYECVDGSCLLSCNTNEDCGFHEVCNLTTGFCGPGCETDAQCDPDNPDAVGDARFGSFCVDYVCSTPCDPPLLCVPGKTECPPGTYCAERQGRAPGDPEEGALHECIPGCESDENCDTRNGETCVDGICMFLCVSDDDCGDGSVCNGGSCEFIGEICLSDDDCGEGSFCGGDGRCASGCRDDAECRDCPKEQTCVNLCGPDPSCQCPDCDPMDWSWLDSCPRARDCVAACPDDPECAARRTGREICLSGTCTTPCTENTDCAEGEACVDVTLGDGTQSRECRTATNAGGGVIDDRFGCGCGEVCTQRGQCAPAICVTDDDCESCAVCEDGTCVPGCGPDSPCPDGSCCGPDGHCHSTCETDADCPDPEMCLQGGCCGIACDPVISCTQNSDCPDGMFCGEENVCDYGCLADGDCEAGEICFERGCQFACVSSSDCSEGEECGPDGFCVPLPAAQCSTDNDCGDGEICLSGACFGGCRADSDCGSGELCIDNRCEFPCASDAECSGSNRGNTCVSNGKTNRALLTQVKAQEERIDLLWAQEAPESVLDAERAKLSQLKAKADSWGSCRDVTSGPLEMGRVGCAPYEECDEEGRCVPTTCSSDLDCNGYSCLEGGQCGYCTGDSQCPGGSVCDVDPETGEGLCVFPCVPRAYCSGDEDCGVAGNGVFCNKLPGVVSAKVLAEGKGLCTKGCRAGECPPGQTCSNGTCLPSCGSDGDCNENSEVCVDGYCQFVGFKCSDDGDCFGGDYCLHGRCVVDNRCISDSDCDGGTCVDGVCDQSTNETPFWEGLGETDCPCNQVCGGDFQCHEATCASDADCDCGTCEKGKCIEECLSNSDCDSGFCVDGGCVGCLEDQHCLDGWVCVDGKCEKPCGGALSEGSCESGLALGDPCDSCPDACPSGSTCTGTGELGSVSYKWDAKAGRAVAVLTERKTCVLVCLTTADCPVGSTCVDGRCAPAPGEIGECTDNWQCAGEAYDDGLTRVCVDGYCQEASGTCFTNSDCAAGELCMDDGICMEAECSSQAPCAGGQTCYRGMCYDSCGVPGLTCSPSTGELADPDAVNCPPGYRCLDGKCIRPGYDGTEELMGCRTGTFCLEGACVPVRQGIEECGVDADCSGRASSGSGVWACVDKQCVDLSLQISSSGVDELSKQGDNYQDPCAAEGLCCGDDGFCAPCACDEDHPCGDGECCDSASGLCVPLSDHPATKYGAPGACRYGEVYCEVITPDGGALIPEEDLQDPSYPGCDYEEVCAPDGGLVTGCKEVLRCWDGKPLSTSQLKEKLARACRSEVTARECECQEGSQPPEENECFQDADCGSCMSCITKYFPGDKCCPVYSKFIRPDGTEIEISGDYKNVCEPRFKSEAEREKNCVCESDDDCGECEKCFMVDQAQGTGDYGEQEKSSGYCVPDCSRCPAGGPMNSDGSTCPTCEEQWGPCAKEVESIQKPGYLDPNTGEYVEPVVVRGCVVDRENPCCQAYQTLEDIRRLSSGCLRIEATGVDGVTRVKQVEACLNFEEGVCAECLVDNDCFGAATCQAGLCVTECGSENSNYDGGGDCTCCADDGTCRQLFENWNENSEGGSCRPCQCTENGVDCRDWAPCDSCYRWERVDGQSGFDESEDNIYKAEYFELEAKVNKLQEQLSATVALKVQPLKDLEQAEGRLNYWQSIEQTTCLGDDQQKCAEARAEVAAAQADVTQIQLYLAGIDNSIATIEENLRQAEQMLNQSGNYKRGEWRQVRQCECCVDGVCRPESDCTYGTCYLCPKKNEEGDYYRAQLYNAAMYEVGGEWVEICPGFRDRQGNPATDPNGGTSDAPCNVYFTVDENACVKHACTDGVAFDQVLPGGNSTRYYEYCTGSIIGCAFEGLDPGLVDSKYKNGWKHEIDACEAGIYVGNNTVPRDQWIKVSQAIGPCKKSCECMWPNGLGHIRGHELPTFVDIISTHPCCNKAMVVGECDPEHPGCQAGWETFYEAGDRTLIARRLQRQVVALERYVAQLDGFRGALLSFRAVQVDELAQINASIGQVGAEEAQLLAHVAQLEQGVKDLEERIKWIENRLSELQPILETLNETRKQIGEDIKALTAERDGLLAQLAPLEDQKAIYETNASNARKAFSKKQGEVLTQEGVVATKEATLATMDPSSIEYATLEQELILDRQTLDDLRSEAAQIEADISAWTDAVSALAEQISDLREEIAEKQSEITTKNEAYAAAASSQGTSPAVREYDELTAELAAKKVELFNTNQEIESTNNTIEELRRLGSDGAGELQAKAENIQELITGIDAAIVSIDQETVEAGEAIAKKKAEIAEIEQDNGTPSGIELVPRPTGALTAEDLRALYKEVIDEAKSSEQETWYP